MWILFGLLAIIMTIINLILYARGRENKHAMALALSFTVLSIWAQYSLIAKFIVENNITGVLDVVPTASMTLLRLVFFSIFLNILPLLLELRNGH